MMILVRKPDSLLKYKLLLLDLMWASGLTSLGVNVLILEMRSLNSRSELWFQQGRRQAISSSSTQTMVNSIIYTEAFETFESVSRKPFMCLVTTQYRTGFTIALKKKRVI